MAELQGPENSEGSQAEANTGSTSVGSFNVGRDVEGNVTVGNNNVVNNIINNYYRKEVEKNVEKHEPEYWALKHPYPMPPNFTGRIDERATLTHWLKEDSENRLFILRALGGFGKSALTWQWLTHDIDPKEYPKVFWWSFYEGDASFEHFIEETLKYLNLEVPQGQRPQVDELLKAMGSQKILLIMDGFERALRAYSSMNAAYQGDDPKVEENQLDCVNLNAEIFLKSVCSLPNIKSKVLMTTRLTPHAVKPRGEFLQGCHEEELTAMQKADAVEFFHKQKIKGTHAEIEAACAPYGYHPLSLRLLAGRILKDFENPADIVVAQKLKIDGDLIQQKHHVLEVSYNSLPPHEQNLLSEIACSRSHVELKMLQSMTKNKETLDSDLHDLVERGLLHFDEKNKKFDLHPIVRRYAYERFTNQDRTNTHFRLRDYFAAVDVPAKLQTFDDLAPVIELYYHTVQTGFIDNAIYIYHRHLKDQIHHQFGTYNIIIELIRFLIPENEYKIANLSQDNQAFTLNELATAYTMSGQPRFATPLFEKAIVIGETFGDRKNLAIRLGNIADTQMTIGAFRDADMNLKRAIEFSIRIGDQLIEGINREYLSSVLIYMGMWKEAEQELINSLKLFDEPRNPVRSHWMGFTCSGFTFYHLMMIRVQKRIENTSLMLLTNSVNNAFKFMEEFSKAHYPIEKEYVHNYWLLGSVERLRGDIDSSEHHLSEALNRCRAMNLVYYEANILLDLAHLRYDQKNYEEAKSLAEEASLITERCGYVLQGADVNLFLAQYALEQEQDKVKAKGYAETALKLATCDGPPYYYKVAYDEAVAMLERLKV